MTLEKKVQLSYCLMLSCFVIVLLVLLAQTLLNPPESSPSNALLLWSTGVLIWLFKVAPFLLLVRGLWQKRHTTSAWLSFLSMLYFIFAVLLIYTPHAALYGWLLSLSSLLLFLSSMLYTRWKKQQLAT